MATGLWLDIVGYVDRGYDGSRIRSRKRDLSDLERRFLSDSNLLGKDASEQPTPIVPDQLCPVCTRTISQSQYLPRLICASKIDVENNIIES